MTDKKTAWIAEEEAVRQEFAMPGTSDRETIGRDLSEKQQLKLIHPYDAVNTIAGQGLHTGRQAEHPDQSERRRALRGAARPVGEVRRG